MSFVQKLMLPTAQRSLVPAQNQSQVIEHMAYSLYLTEVPGSSILKPNFIFIVKSTIMKNQQTEMLRCRHDDYDNKGPTGRTCNCSLKLWNRTNSHLVKITDDLIE